MKLFLSVVALSAAIAVSPIATSHSHAQDWATLKVKFIYDGKPPAPAFHNGDKEPFCSVLKIPDERMVVGKDGALANVSLIMDISKSKANDIHPDLKDPPKEPVVIDNNGCMFVPHVAFVRTGQKLIIKNSDQCGHNAKLDFFSNKSTNDMIPSNNSVEYVLNKAERANANHIECSIHPWMKADLIVRDHPYVGISDADGVLVIEKMPVGEVTFKIAHENQDGSIEEGQLDGKQEKWRRGALELTLKPGMNEHTITLSEDVFQK